MSFYCLNYPQRQFFRTGIIHFCFLAFKNPLRFQKPQVSVSPPLVVSVRVDSALTLLCQKPWGSKGEKCTSWHPQQKNRRRFLLPCASVSRTAMEDVSASRVLARSSERWVLITDSQEPYEGVTPSIPGASGRPACGAELDIVGETKSDSEEPSHAIPKTAPGQ